MEAATKGDHHMFLLKSHASNKNLKKGNANLSNAERKKLQRSSRGKKNSK